jgi:hypothetical protein
MTNILNKRAIILTATIIPNSIYTSHVNPENRLNDYITALKFYCNIFKKDDVFFIENSEYDLDNNNLFNELKSTLKFKVIRFPKSNEFDRGKGYQEFEMLQKTIELLKNEYNFYIKITGRYIIKNIYNITKNYKNGYYIDLRTKTKAAEVYLLAFDIDSFNSNIFDAYKLVNDIQGIYIEQILFSNAINTKIKSKVHLFTPLLSGISGSNSIILKRNIVRVILRNFERVFNRLIGKNQFFY